jgi:hypothetical protein
MMLRGIAERARRRGRPVPLAYEARDKDRNNAVVVTEVLKWLGRSIRVGRKSA